MSADKCRTLCHGAFRCEVRSIAQWCDEVQQVGCTALAYGWLPCLWDVVHASLRHKQKSIRLTFSFHALGMRLVPCLGCASFGPNDMHADGAKLAIEMMDNIELRR